MSINSLKNKKRIAYSYSFFGADGRNTTSRVGKKVHWTFLAFVQSLLRKLWTWQPPFRSRPAHTKKAHSFFKLCALGMVQMDIIKLPSILVFLNVLQFILFLELGSKLFLLYF